MKTTQMGQQALSGWRVKVGAPIATAVARRTGLEAEQVQAVIGAAFFLSSLWYVISTISAASKKR